MIAMKKAATLERCDKGGSQQISKQEDTDARLATVQPGNKVTKKSIRSYVFLNPSVRSLSTVRLYVYADLQATQLAEQLIYYIIKDCL